PVDRAYSRYSNAKAKYDRNINMSFEEKLKECVFHGKPGHRFTAWRAGISRMRGQDFVAGPLG
ncbi:MAG: hypothetical protein ACRETX_03285, partial [Steroidobacteraceae bacterium]